jgi:hypothetical protein
VASLRMWLAVSQRWLGLSEQRLGLDKCNV